MSVVCAACKTENRDAAMFCRGCAAKLPGFAATGPAALDITRPLPQAGPPEAERREGPVEGLLQLESRAFWLRLGVLALVITVAFVGWYGYVTRRASPPAVPTVAAPDAAPAPPARPAPVVAPAPPALPAQVPVPPADALSPGETLAPAATAPAHARGNGIGPRNGTSSQREPAIRRRDPPETVASAPVRAASADPRPGCAHLNFIAAARCEAAQCSRSPYRTHPHCGVVREQTRRDEARRNLPN